jgi:hypothetical protein
MQYGFFCFFKRLQTSNCSLIHLSLDQNHGYEKAIYYFPYTQQLLFFNCSDCNYRDYV